MATGIPGVSLISISSVEARRRSGALIRTKPLWQENLWIFPHSLVSTDDPVVNHHARPLRHNVVSNVHCPLCSARQQERRRRVFSMSDSSTSFPRSITLSISSLTFAIVTGFRSNSAIVHSTVFALVSVPAMINSCNHI
ncbi:hypothetical protein IHE45_04G128300 [Dioscorea alata]|uniref:Uncharacterized protein n=1 Tax=Dioscorea alata TaxID=55571 RepID=A0ACB7WG25_DIOAL|nr:hypothetical protein IHE45_04G128300 [Dioscorea alata]